MLDWVSQPESWAALATLTLLETVLGIDNIIFISILAGKLHPDRRSRARRLGLLLAMGTRILLLMSLAWILKLTQPLFSVFGQAVSGRDLILVLGGLFLLAKSTFEIHDNLEGEQHVSGARAAASFSGVLVQIALLDIVFSLDSVITAVGMANDLAVMVLAVMISIAIMLAFAGAIGAFVERHPTVKMLALSFLLLIGMSLVAEGFDVHMPKGYIYFAMGFSVFVEMLNLRLRRGPPVKLHRNEP
jgi:predicted tellurium resistance membrane protein TerC